MKKFYILFLLSLAPIFIICNNCHAATVGNPLDLDVPAKSSVLRQAVIERTLEEYEQIVKIKTALDLEFVFRKDLHGPCGVGVPDTGLPGEGASPGQEVSGAELKGQWYMVKLGTTIFNRIEPYIKIGTSRLEVKWRQNKAVDIEIEADYGFAWGGGVKVVIWDFDDWGIRLTGDGQYRTTEPDVSEISLGNISTVDPNVDFVIKEWQASLILSKKFELPLRWQSIYIVPYTGFSLSDSTVDVKVTNTSDPTQDWTLFDANNDSIYGFILGCDIMPSLTSFFTYSMELRLFNETALTLGGAMKF